ncbi:family 16 glycosylhydrolase [Buchananella hordeovulneris]|uniref:Glycosyl hydrolase family 16 n=1 Tax=Buchananella hordeovulneris TaxID=52770 RepID=A0A1Q5PY27_9ACTO|nr:family 16 glycosylhydrolase [Buchananella hordeovulneris]MDO5079740.1 family 16 glycosylhydrolase [Buchananella hordeovulneris]OKL52362.1 glycosyl hydrolase family 16 [Buchananella hordeovulneris]
MRRGTAVSWLTMVLAGGFVGACSATPTADEATAPPTAVTKTQASSRTALPSPTSSPTMESAAPSQSAAPVPSAESQDPASPAAADPAALPGWRIDFFDDFEQPITDSQWERYGWGDPPVGQGAMGIRSQDETFTRDGNLVVRTRYTDGQWRSGGVSSKQLFSASRGRWEVRARFPQAKGIGYAFLLWPVDEGWPPEIDFAEGHANGPQVMGVYHWDPDNKQEHRFFDNPSMDQWHTYGVIVEDKRIIFTFDGEEWGRIDHPQVTDKPMFVGFQAGAMDPHNAAPYTEVVDGGVPGPLTPATAEIEIDYVAHYVPD